MRCPKCDSDKLSVIDSRGDGNAIRRRRQCQGCDFRFNTYERVEYSLPLVIKKDGRREAFDRGKVRAGLIRACEKRPVSISEIDAMLERCERALQELCVKEVESGKIGELIMDALRKLDKIAYVRFASVYREFSDVSQFVDTLESLSQSEKQEARIGTAQIANS